MGLLLVVLFIFIVKGLSSATTSLQTASTPLPSASGASTAATSGTANAEIRNGVQEVALNVSAAGYNPGKLVMKKGIPVRIITDSTEDAGCVRGIMIPDFNINEPLEIGRDTLEFTPDKAGTFEFMCQMRMSKGTLEVIS